MNLTIQHFQAELHGKHVQVRSDNTTTCAYINKMGGTKSQTMCWQVVDLLKWCIANQIQLSAIHVPGVENVLADFLSRQEVDQREWSLHGRVVNQVFARWERPHIDLFASVHNYKLKTFCSLIPTPLSISSNAFTVDWGRFALVYAFPPLAIILKVLYKIRRDQARAILIAPRWPRRGWYAILLNMITEEPLLLPDRHDLLSQQGALHPGPQLLELVAWRVSGVDSEHKAFLSRLSRRYREREPRPQRQAMSPSGQPLTAGVLGGVSIPLQQL